MRFFDIEDSGNYLLPIIENIGNSSLDKADFIMIKKPSKKLKNYISKEKIENSIFGIHNMPEETLIYLKYKLKIKGVYRFFLCNKEKNERKDKLYDYSVKLFKKRIKKMPSYYRMQIPILKKLSKLRRGGIILTLLALKKKGIRGNLLQEVPHLISILPLMLLYKESSFGIFILGLALPDLTKFLLFDKTFWHNFTLIISLFLIPFKPEMAAAGIIHIILDWFGF